MDTDAQHSRSGIKSEINDSDRLDQSESNHAKPGKLLPGCIALIGLDGAGKTTIARLLLKASSRPMKYLYMGTAIGSSNYALPTSRLLHYLREQKSRKAHPKAPQKLRPLERTNTRGHISAAFVLIHRLCEEWFRQMVSWFFQLRGYRMLYDRHFLFECAPNDRATQQPRKLSDRIHFWLLSHAYPKPRLTFFLDAPPEVLFARKPEATLEYLAERRSTYLNLGRRLPNFYRIDATQPADDVLREVQSVIDRIYEISPETHDNTENPGET